MTRFSARYLAPAALIGAMALLAGCGMAETTAATAAMAEAKAQEVKAAKETQARIEQKLDDAQAAAAQQRANAEKLSE
jgi:outer membrane lipopolysaccharide assembly protein LptE/RlpB